MTSRGNLNSESTALILIGGKAQRSCPYVGKAGFISIAGGNGDVSVFE
jgi:hypothetical protein